MGAKRAKSDEINLQANMSASRAATLLAYLAAASVEGPEAPPAEILEPYRKREGKKDRSALTQLAYALSSEKEDKDRCVLVNACWLEGTSYRVGGKHATKQQACRRNKSRQATNEQTSLLARTAASLATRYSMMRLAFLSLCSLTPPAHPLNKITWPMQQLHLKLNLDLAVDLAVNAFQIIPPTPLSTSPN